MARTKVTPKWLSILRKIWTYGGATTIISMLEGRFGLLPKDVLLMIELWALIGAIIQAICDTSFAKEPLGNMPVKESKVIKS